MGRRSFGEEMGQIWQRLVGKHGHFLVAVVLCIALSPLLSLVVYFFPLLLCTGLCVAVFRSVGDEAEQDCGRAGTSRESRLERWVNEVCAFPKPGPGTKLRPEGSTRNHSSHVAGFSSEVMPEARASGNAEFGYGHMHEEEVQGKGKLSQEEAAAAKAEAVDSQITPATAQRGAERFAFRSLEMEPERKAEFGYGRIREADLQENGNSTQEEAAGAKAEAKAVDSQISTVPAQHGVEEFAFGPQDEEPERTVVPTPNRVTSPSESSGSPVRARRARETAQSRRERGRIEKLQVKEAVARDRLADWLVATRYPAEELASPPRVEPDLENLEMLAALVETSPERVVDLRGERHRQNERLCKIPRLGGRQMLQGRWGETLEACGPEGKKMLADLERIAQARNRWQEWLDSFGPEGKKTQELLDRSANSQQGLDGQADSRGPASPVNLVQQPHPNQASILRPECSVTPVAEDCRPVVEWPTYSSSDEAQAQSLAANAGCGSCYTNWRRRKTSGVHEINPAPRTPAPDTSMLTTPSLNREESVATRGEWGTAPRTPDSRVPGAGVTAQVPHRGPSTFQARKHNAGQDSKGKKRLFVEDSRLNRGANVGETWRERDTTSVEAVTSGHKPKPVSEPVPVPLPVSSQSTTPAAAPLRLDNKPGSRYDGNSNNEVAAVGFAVSGGGGRGRKGTGAGQLQGPSVPLPQWRPVKRYPHIEYETQQWNDLNSRFADWQSTVSAVNPKLKGEVKEHDNAALPPATALKKPSPMSP